MWKGVVRYGVVLLAGIIAGGRAVDAVQAWREWHRWAQRDPSAADAYRTFWMADLAVAALSLAIAILIWWLLRPSAGRVGRAPASEDQ
jgi:H+/Cl- antiporter ClcA